MAGVGRATSASRKVVRAIEALRSGFASQPRALRGYAIALVTELAEGDGGGWYELQMVDGEPLPSKHHAVGLPASIFRHQLDERIPYPHGDPRLPDPRWNRRFVLLRGVVSNPERELFPSRLYDRCWRPARVGDQLRMTVHHNGEMVAWLGALRLEGVPVFGRAEARRLAPVADALADALVAARAVERTGEPETSADLLVAADGTVELCSEAAKSLIDNDDARDALGAWVRAIDRSVGDAHATEHGAHAPADRIRGPRRLDPRGARGHAGRHAERAHGQPVAPRASRATEA